MRKILSFIMIVLGVSIFLICLTGFRVNIISGQSMEPTFEDGTIVFSWHSSIINRNQIVILNLNDEYLIKRVIGIPGDVVWFNKKEILINPDQIYGVMNKIVLSPSQYFVAGDNRKISEDSRYFGPIDLKNILGIVPTKKKGL